MCDISHSHATGVRIPCEPLSALARRLTFPGPYFGDRTYDPANDRARLAAADDKDGK